VNKVTSASLRYPLSVFNKNSTLTPGTPPVYCPNILRVCGAVKKEGDSRLLRSSGFRRCQDKTLKDREVHYYSTSLLHYRLGPVPVFKLPWGRLGRGCSYERLPRMWALAGCSTSKSGSAPVKPYMLSCPPASQKCSNFVQRHHALDPHTTNAQTAAISEISTFWLILIKVSSLFVRISFFLGRPV